MSVDFAEAYDYFLFLSWDWERISLLQKITHSDSKRKMLEIQIFSTSCKTPKAPHSSSESKVFGANWLICLMGINCSCLKSILFQIQYLSKFMVTSVGFFASVKCTKRANPVQCALVRVVCYFSLILAAFWCPKRWYIVLSSLIFAQKSVFGCW